MNIPPDIPQYLSVVILGLVGLLLRRTNKSSTTTGERLERMGEIISGLQGHVLRMSNAMDEHIGDFREHRKSHNDLMMRIEGLEYKFKSLKRREEDE